MSAWKDDKEEVPPSKIALKMVNVLVSVICGWYLKIGCWEFFFIFMVHVLNSGAFQHEMMVCRYMWIQNE